MSTVPIPAPRLSAAYATVLKQACPSERIISHPVHESATRALIRLGRTMNLLCH